MEKKRVRLATYGVAVVFLINSACGSTVKSTVTSEPIALPSENEGAGKREIVLKAFQGEVRVINVMSLEENPAVAGQKIALGDTISVGEGSAALEIDDGMVVLLDKYSLLTLALLEGTTDQPRTRFYQWMGEAYHLHEGEIPQGGLYEIEMVGLTASGYGGTWQSNAVFPIKSLVQETYSVMHGDAPDGDGDGVPDALDTCPAEAGPAWAQDGCPENLDSDGDGIIDEMDACPYEFGTGQESGCPVAGDIDADGVADNNDRCLYEPGTIEESGCPPIGDSDEDGLADDIDHCPFQDGTAEQDGCPSTSDTDGDGLNDDKDDCPYLPGSAVDHGCLVEGDADADGLPDDDDRCPFTPGPLVNSGCPLEEPDGDADGLPDVLDGCPLEPGPAENAGCPEVPDFDLDGVPDFEDACPLVAAPGSADGCAEVQDTDEDGIPKSKEATEKTVSAAQDCLREVQGVDDIKAQAFEELSKILAANQDVVSGVIKDMTLVPVWDVGGRMPKFNPGQPTDCSEGYSSTVVNLDGDVDVSVTQEDGSQTKDIPLDPSSVMTVAGASPGDSASSVVALTTLPSGAKMVVATTLMQLSGDLKADLPDSSLPRMDIAITMGGARCNPLADSFDECEEGLWDYEMGECDCAVICPSFTHMQSCNAHVHWGCLWVEDTCYNTAVTAMLQVQNNSYCRSGPGLMYPAITSFTPGTELEILGTSDAFGAVWWQVKIPHEDGVCWISGTLVTSPISPDLVSQVPPPPTPTPKPQPEGGGGGGLKCSGTAQSKAACGDGLWDPVAKECDCSVLCKKFNDQPLCQAHADWYCSWTEPNCVGPWD